MFLISAEGCTFIVTRKENLASGAGWAELSHVHCAALTRWDCFGRGVAIRGGATQCVKMSQYKKQSARLRHSYRPIEKQMVSNGTSFTKSWLMYVAMTASCMKKKRRRENDWLTKCQCTAMSLSTCSAS